MTTPLLTSLLSDLSDDLRDSRMMLQVASVLLCFALTWLTARLFKKISSNQHNHVVPPLIAAASFGRVLWPSFLTLYIALAKVILARLEHTNLLTLVFPIVASLALIRFGFYVVRRTFARDGRIGSFLAIFEKLFAGLVWLGVVLHFMGMWQDLFVALDSIYLPIGHNKVSLLNALQAIGSVAITLVVALWASAALEAKLMQLQTMHTSLQVVLSRIGRAFLILIAILVSLTIVGIDLTVLSVFGGALGVGLGFGLQKITSSYVSGFIILFDRSMSIGDVISVDKYSGKVTQINTRYTVLKGVDGGESVIPNEMLVSSPVQNYSLSDRSVMITTDMTVSYQTDIESLIPVLCETVAAVERVANKPQPVANLLKFGADGLELRVQFWIDDPENGRINVQSDVNRALWKVLKEHKIELPYAHRVVTLLSPLPQNSDESVKNA